MANGETGNDGREFIMETRLDNGAKDREAVRGKTGKVRGKVFRSITAGVVSCAIGVFGAVKASAGDEKPVDLNAGKKNPPISEKSTTGKADTPAVVGKVVADASKTPMEEVDILDAMMAKDEAEIAKIKAEIEGLRKRGSNAENVGNQAVEDFKKKIAK